MSKPVYYYYYYYCYCYCYYYYYYYYYYYDHSNYSSYNFCPPTETPLHRNAVKATKESSYESCESFEVMSQHSQRSQRSQLSQVSQLSQRSQLSQLSQRSQRSQVSRLSQLSWLACVSIQQAECKNIRMNCTVAAFAAFAAWRDSQTILSTPCVFFSSSPFGSKTNSDFNFQIDFARVDLFHFTPLASLQQCCPNKWADFPLELFGNVNHWVIVANPNLGIDLEAFNICFEIALDYRTFVDQKSVASGAQ